MAGKNTQKVVYEDRETLDAEINSAIADILSAEHEAARIVAQAEASVTAVQLDYANRERALRERAAVDTAKSRDDAVSAAAERARSESAKKLDATRESGKRLSDEKRKLIDEIAKELYVSLGGKK